MMVLLSCVAITVQAAQEDKESRVKSNADLASERVLELQTKQAVHIEKAAAKNQNEKNLYRHKIADLNEELTISASLDSSTLVCGKSADGSIKIKDLGKDHKLRDIRIKASDLAGLPCIDKGIVKITHFNDAGLPDAVWIQEIRNDNGYVYFEGIPFSEVIIGGFVGDYEKSGVVTYQTSQTFSLGTAFNAANVNYLEATVTPTYTETSPYDIPTNGLVGWWRFDEGSGTLVQDFSENGNNGTATGMTWTDGKYNSAGSFADLNGALVTIQDDQSLKFGNNSFSINFVAKFPFAQQSAYALFASKGEATEIAKTHSWAITARSTSTNALKYYEVGEAGSFATSTDIATEITDGYHTVTFIRDVENHKLNTYIDGVSKTSINYPTITDVSGNYPLKIGDIRLTTEIDNVMIYNRSISQEEIKQIYYDSLEDLTLKTNSNAGTSTAIDETGTVNVPYDSTDADITSLTAYVPENVTIGGVTVRDYSNTVTPFEVMATVGYTEDTTLISEELTDTYYQIVIKHTPGNDYNPGTVSYTSDNNAILQSSYLTYSMTSTNPNAVLSYNDVTRKWTISTGAITEGTTYSYNIIASLTSTPVLEVQDGVGDEHVETYPETGNTTTAIGSTFTCVGNDGGWTNGSDIWNTTASLLIVVIVIIFGGLAIQKLRGVTNHKGDDY